MDKLFGAEHAHELDFVKVGDEEGATAVQLINIKEPSAVHVEKN